MLSKENQLKVAGISAVLATTLGLGGALVAPATALAVPKVNPATPSNKTVEVKPTAEAEHKDNQTPEKDFNYQKDQDPDQGAHSTNGIVEVVRLYNQWTGEHLFTSDQNEVRDCEIAGWTNEQVYWKAYNHAGDQMREGAVAGDAIYRLYNPFSGDHLYTSSDTEYVSLQSEGWKGEGVMFYAAKPSDADPSKEAGSGRAIDQVYRQFNPHETVGTHCYAGIEENATMLSNGWLPDFVKDGKQMPAFYVFDLQHDTSENKISDALVRISKEYNANLNEYKALEKEIVDSIISGKFDKDALKNKIARINEIAKNHEAQLKDVESYLLTLKGKADKVIADLKDKYGDKLSEAYGYASEVGFKKDNYLMLKKQIVDAEKVAAEASSALTTNKLALAGAEAELQLAQAAQKAAEARVQEATKNVDTTSQDNKNYASFVEQLNAAKSDLEAAKKVVETKKAAVNKAKEPIEADETHMGSQKCYDAKAATVQALTQKAIAQTSLFKTNLEKFKDFRYKQSLKESQALRDVQFYNEYVYKLIDLNTDVKTLDVKSTQLKDAVDKGTGLTELSQLFTKAFADKKLPDAQAIKEALENAYADFFKNLQKEPEELQF